MTVETVPIDSLRSDPANARSHGKRNLDAIVASLRRFGQQKPIVVDSDGVVRAGNGQFAAAKALGWSHVQIVRSNLAATDLTAYAIADNRTAELAEWDELVLGSQLANMDLRDVGFSEAEFRRFVKEESHEVFEPIVDIHELFEVVVECPNENGQRQLYERLKAQGYSCRLFTL